MGQYPLLVGAAPQLLCLLVATHKGQWAVAVGLPVPLKGSAAAAAAATETTKTAHQSAV